MATRSEAQRVARWLTKHYNDLTAQSVEPNIIRQIVGAIYKIDTSAIPRPPYPRGRKYGRISNEKSEKIGELQNTSPIDYIKTVCAIIRMYSQPDDRFIYINYNVHESICNEYFDNTPKGFSIFILALKDLFPGFEDMAVYRVVRMSFEGYNVGEYNTLNYHKTEEHAEVQRLASAIYSTDWDL